MITELDIQNFRGFRTIRLSGLRSVNLLVGENDTGKTNILEALVLLLGDGSALRSLPVTFRTNQSGGQSIDDQNDRENFWAWLFLDRDPKQPISIVARIDSSVELSAQSKLEARGDYPHGPLEPVMRRTDSRDAEDVGQARAPIRGAELLRLGDQNLNIGGANSPADIRVAVLSTRPTNPTLDAENYNQVALTTDGEQRIETIMREVEPRLKRLRYAKLPGTTSPLVFVDIGLSRAVPAPQMGQAFNRLLHIYAALFATKANVLLVDEIENGIFGASMPLVWGGLFSVCAQEKVQIFATTHSLECVRAALLAAQKRGKQELSVQRLQLVGGAVQAVALSQEMLAYALENNLEIRK